MPFIELLYGPRVDADVVVTVRDDLLLAVGKVLERVDPDHSVTSAMVDVRCIPTGPLDVVRPDLLVTVLARTEPARHNARLEIARQLGDIARSAAPDLDVMLEVVLTDRTSTYEYP